MSHDVFRPQSFEPPLQDTVNPAGCPPRHPEWLHDTRAVRDFTYSADTLTGAFGVSLTVIRMTPVRWRDESRVASAAV